MQSKDIKLKVDEVKVAGKKVMVSIATILIVVLSD